MMQNYSRLIEEELPGSTPQAKFDSLQLMKKCLAMVAYPKYGIENHQTLDDIATTIQVCFTREDLDSDYK